MAAADFPLLGSLAEAKSLVEELASSDTPRERWLKAIEAMEDAARRCEDRAERRDLYLLIGKCHHSRLRQRQAALESYLVGFMCDPVEGELLERLRDLYTALGKTRELIGLYDVLLDEAYQRQLSPHVMARLWVEKGHLQFSRAANADAAAYSLLQALNIRPDDQALIELLRDHVANKIKDPQLRLAAKSAVARISED